MSAQDIVVIAGSLIIAVFAIAVYVMKGINARLDKNDEKNAMHVKNEK
jgi:hypothetical protein